MTKLLGQSDECGALYCVRVCLSIAKWSHYPVSSLAVENQTYPFTAIVGQEEMKLALILNVVDPLIGGVLIMGHRGTGKSTAVRALADLLPEIEVIAGCPYNCDPQDERNLCDQCRERTEV